MPNQLYADQLALAPDATLRFRYSFVMTAQACVCTDIDLRLCERYKFDSGVLQVDPGAIELGPGDVDQGIGDGQRSPGFIDLGRKAARVDQGERLTWLHVHETWLPSEVMAAGPYDF